MWSQQQREALCVWPCDPSLQVQPLHLRHFMLLCTKCSSTSCSTGSVGTSSSTSAETPFSCPRGALEELNKTQFSPWCSWWIIWGMGQADSGYGGGQHCQALQRLPRKPAAAEKVWNVPVLWTCGQCPHEGLLAGKSITDICRGESKMVASLSLLVFRGDQEPWRGLAGNNGCGACAIWDHSFQNKTEPVNTKNLNAFPYLHRAHTLCTVVQETRITNI